MNTALSLARICRRLRLPLPRHDHSLQFNRWWETLQPNGAALGKSHSPSLADPASGSLTGKHGQTASPANFDGKGGDCASNELAATCRRSGVADALLIGFRAHCTERERRVLTTDDCASSEMRDLLVEVLRYGETFAWRDRAMAVLGLTLDDL